GASQPLSPASPTPARSGDDPGGVVAFWLFVGAVYWIARYRQRPRPVPSPQVGAAVPLPRDTYRPRAHHAARGGITFTDPRSDTVWNPQEADLTDVRDAITGQTLRPELGLHLSPH